MSRLYSLRHDLVAKHARSLDMISLAPPAPVGTEIVPAVACSLNPGVLDVRGQQLPMPNFIYVDDCLLASARRLTLRMLAGCIEAIFAVLGFPDVERRQCPLALDK